MDKKYKFVVILAALSMALAVVTPAFAQTPTLPTPHEGPLSEYMVEAFAASVGLSVEEIQTRMANGETLRDITQSLGYDKDMMADVSSTALSAAVSAGAITQEQADKITNRKRQGGPGGFAMLEKLGLSGEEFKALIESGMTIQEIFAQQGVEFTPRTPNGNGNIAEQCGLSQEEIKARLDAGESMQDICPGVELPEKGDGTRPAHRPGKSSEE